MVIDRTAFWTQKVKHISVSHETFSDLLSKMLIENCMLYVLYVTEFFFLNSKSYSVLVYIMVATVIAVTFLIFVIFAKE